MLTNMVNAFRQQHTDIRVGLFHTGPTWEKILKNPRKYGFMDGESACGSRECVWNTDVEPPLHPTFGVHRILAEDIAEFLETF
jgi:phospholipase/lecithinase/hemolysin